MTVTGTFGPVTQAGLPSMRGRYAGNSGRMGYTGVESRFLLTADVSENPESGFS